MARLWDPANSTPIARFTGICTFCFAPRARDNYLARGKVPCAEERAKRQFAKATNLCPLAIHCLPLHKCMVFQAASPTVPPESLSVGSLCCLGFG
jgi:hypothetical protein